MEEVDVQKSNLVSCFLFFVVSTCLSKDGWQETDKFYWGWKCEISYLVPNELPK